MKIVTVIGARPQFIKAAVVSAALRRHRGLTEIVVHTGQHFDDNMSGVFFTELGIAPPAYHFAIHGGTHGAMTGQMLIEIERVLLAEHPDVVMVYGDTNSTLAGALAAVKLEIPVAHVEAGLRSFNMAMPEEVNRIVADRVARWLFTPTTTAARNLEREGVPGAHIVPVGDVMYDAALHYAARAAESDGVVGTLGLAPREYVLATVHRAENTDDPVRLGRIVEALEHLSHDVRVIWPVHPRTRAALGDGAVSRGARLTLIDPVGYLDMVRLERHAALIATDSGGVQKEAFFYEVPCVTLRDETEWVELIEMGWNRLAPPTDAASIYEALRAALGTRGREAAPYGDGTAAVKIADHLASA